MLTLPNGFGFYRAYNKETFDPLHDIVVSFEYSMYSYNAIPTGGISLAFYDNAINIPQGGGVAGALGYTNSLGVLVNSVSGFSGLIGAHMGIGFDFTGKFSQNSEGRTTGSIYTSPNSIAIRANQNNNYSLIALNSNLQGFTIADTLTGSQSIHYKKAKVILTNNGQRVIVQIYQNGQYITVATNDITYLPSNNLGVCLTFSSEDTNTNFQLKKFDVMGTLKTDDLSTKEVVCKQVFQTVPFDSLEVESDNIWITDNYLLGETNTGNSLSLWEDNEWIGKGFIASNSLNFDVPREVLSYKSNYVLAKGLNTLDINLYEFKGNNWVTRTTFFTGNVNWGTVADINSTYDTVIFNNSNISVVVYERTFDTWNNTQMLTTSASYVSGFGSKIKIDGNTLAIASGTNTLHIFEKVNGIWEEVQIFNITDAYGDYSFGYDMDIKGDTIVVGAPTQSNIFTGDGSVYVFKRTNGIWNFYQKIYGSSFTSSNFGHSVKIDSNNLLVGTPGFPNSYLFNSGTVYYYQDSGDGVGYIYQWGYTSSQPQPNAEYGRKVAINGNKIAVRDTNNIYVYNLLCGPQFTQIPNLLPCTIRLMSNYGVGMRRMLSGNFLGTMECPPIIPVPPVNVCELVTIINSIPINSINGLNIIVPFTCVTPTSATCELATIYNNTPIYSNIGGTLMAPISCH